MRVAEYSGKEILVAAIAEPDKIDGCDIFNGVENISSRRNLAWAMSPARLFVRDAGKTRWLRK